MAVLSGLEHFTERISRFLASKISPYIERKADPFSLRLPMEPPIGRASEFVRGTVIEPRLKELKLHERLDEFVMRDNLPVPPTERRENYFEDRHFEYWLSGLQDYLTILEFFPEIDWAKTRVLDFGGATGRVARHFYAQSGCKNVTIADVNINHVDWVAEHFPSDFASVKTGPLPTLPFSDGDFDAVLAFSVFTHIDIYEYAWLCELRRVLRPDGILYVTVQNDDTWSILPTIDVFNHLWENKEFAARYAPGAELSERTVARYSEEDVYNCNVFHPNRHIRKNWARFLDVVDILPTAHAFQSAVIMRNRLS